MLKVCIIGAGMIAKRAHIPAYKAYPEIYEIAAVSDFYEEAAKNCAAEFGIKNYYTDAEKMLIEQKPDVVSICAPNMLHKEYTMLALKHGANVLCEKPLELSYKNAKEMFSYAESQGKLLMACQSLRFLPERQKAYEMVLAGEIGYVHYADVSRIRRRGIPTWGKFHIKEFSGGGAFLDIGIHSLDSAVWLMGNPKPVSVKANMIKIHVDELGTAESAGALKGGVDNKGFNPDDMDVESFSSGRVTFENGAVLNFKVAWAANLKEENNIILSGKKCGVDMENRKIYSGVDTVDELNCEPNGFSYDAFYGHHCLVENFANAINGKAELAVKPEETLNVTAIMEAAYLSAESGEEVILKY